MNPSKVPELDNNPKISNNLIDFQAGTILGLHNTFIVLPQFLSSMTCGLVWKAAGQINGMEWIWRISALSSFIAAISAYAASRKNL
jgi:hypothetical protein